jgi:uncharacterized RDD family membrane protein YckC
MKYHLARGEEQLGTFNDLDVSAGLREGRFKPTDLCWADGMAEWKTLGSHLQELNMEDDVSHLAEPPAIAALRAEVRQDQILRLEPASRGQRFAAKLIDLLMLLVPFVVYYTIVFDPAVQEELRPLQKDPVPMVDVMKVIQRRIEAIQASGNVIPDVMGMIMNMVLLTNVILLSIRGQTIGKMCLGIQVVRCPRGDRAGFVKAVMLRSMLVGILILGSIIYFGLMGIVVLLANALMIFRQDRRCMHDLVADTMVMKRIR